MTEIALVKLTAAHLGKHVRQTAPPTGITRRNWKPVAGQITSIRHFYDRVQQYTAKGKPTGTPPVMHTALIVEVGRDDRGAYHREILAESTQKVDVNQ